MQPAACQQIASSAAPSAEPSASFGDCNCTTASNVTGYWQYMSTQQSDNPCAGTRDIMKPAASQQIASPVAPSAAPPASLGDCNCTMASLQANNVNGYPQYMSTLQSDNPCVGTRDLPQPAANQQLANPVAFSTAPLASDGDCNCPSNGTYPPYMSTLQSSPNSCLGAGGNLMPAASQRAASPLASYAAPPSLGKLNILQPAYTFKADNTGAMGTMPMSTTQIAQPRSQPTSDESAKDSLGTVQPAACNTISVGQQPCLGATQDPNTSPTTFLA